jgi:hypothetical protein
MGSTSFYRQADLRTYGCAAAFFAKARQPAKGRPLRWARLYRVGEDYVLQHGSITVGRFTPDNKFRFEMDAHSQRSSAVTLSQAMFRTVPFVWLRVATGRYVVAHTYAADMKRKGANIWRWTLDEGGTPVFNGLTFDLDTGEPLNPRPRHTTQQVDTEQRLEWLRGLRKFKRAIHVRRKLGVLDKLMDEVRAENRALVPAPDWLSDRWLNQLASEIKAGECSTDLLKGMLRTVGNYTWQSKETIYHLIDKLLRDCSVELRQRFGVFTTPDPEVVSSTIDK